MRAPTGEIGAQRQSRRPYPAARTRRTAKRLRRGPHQANSEAPSPPPAPGEQRSAFAAARTRRTAKRLRRGPHQANSEAPSPPPAPGEQRSAFAAVRTRRTAKRLRRRPHQALACWGRFGGAERARSVGAYTPLESNPPVRITIPTPTKEGWGWWSEHGTRRSRPPPGRSEATGGGGRRSRVPPRSERSEPRAVVGATGFEPVTHGLKDRCSTD